MPRVLLSSVPFRDGSCSISQNARHTTNSSHTNTTQHPPSTHEEQVPSSSSSSSDPFQPQQQQQQQHPSMEPSSPLIPSSMAGTLARLSILNHQLYQRCLERLALERLANTISMAELSAHTPQERTLTRRHSSPAMMLCPYEVSSPQGSGPSECPSPRTWQPASPTSESWLEET